MKIVWFSVWSVLLVSLSISRGQETGKEMAVSIDPVRQATVKQWVDSRIPDLVNFYKQFHAHPELSLQELKTAAAIAREWEKAGFAVTLGVGGTGVVGVLANGPGPTVLIRGDMDALPVIEETGLDYASKVRVKLPNGTEVGAMHACGHDVHCTMLLGVAALLSDLKNQWSGTALLIAQPAEEVGKGAKMMIEDGLFERFPRPDVCLSLHVKNDLPAGSIGYTAGFAFANVDSVDITIFGKGGHGASPNTAIDPVVMAAQVVMGLQTIVSRHVDPVEPAVITVGSIHGGTKHNIIPDEVKLQLTVRSYTEEIREQLLSRIRDLTTGICRACGAPKDPLVVLSDENTPASYNDPALTQSAMNLFRHLYGESSVQPQKPTMGGEDFGRFARFLKVPGLQYRIGVISLDRWEASRQPGAKPLPALHSALFYPQPEPSVRMAVESMANLALAIFEKK